MELLKQAGWSATRTQLFHFRTASGQEVDFLLESDAGAIVGIEVKASATVTGHDFNGLRALSGDDRRAIPSRHCAICGE
jgi:predicted AAA+ superfamily ATPase